MKQVALYSLLAFSLALGTAFMPSNPPEAEQLEWHTKLEQAHALSIKNNKPIFAFFTGSDWCGWCMRLQANVFAKPAFVSWAKENVILLELDYPRRKQLPPDLAKQNNELKNFFRPAGFPTIWIFDMKQDTATKSFQINAMGSLGYPSGSQPGKEEVTFIANADRILQSKK